MRMRMTPVVAVAIGLMVVAVAWAQPPSAARVASVDVRQIEGHPPVLVLTANGPIAWRVLDPLPQDAPDLLRVKLYGIQRGDVEAALTTPLGRLTLADDGAQDLRLTLGPSAADGRSWVVRLGRDANILEVGRR